MDINKIRSLTRVGVIFIVLLVLVPLCWEFSSQSIDAVDSEILLFRSDSLRHRKHKINRKIPIVNSSRLSSRSSNNAHDLHSISAKHQFAGPSSHNVAGEFSIDEDFIQKAEAIAKAISMLNATSKH